MVDIDKFADKYAHEFVDKFGADLLAYIQVIRTVYIDAFRISNEVAAKVADRCKMLGYDDMIRAHNHACRIISSDIRSLITPATAPPP